MDLWRPILGGVYEVSVLGDVRRVAPGRGTIRDRPRKCQNKDGYRSVSLSVEGKPRRYYVHRLVAEAFLGPIPAGLIVNHKDGDRWNAALTNLEYVTHKENSILAGRAGQLAQGEQHRYAKATEEQVRE